MPSGLIGIRCEGGQCVSAVAIWFKAMALVFRTSFISRA